MILKWKYLDIVDLSLVRTDTGTLTNKTGKVDWFEIRRWYSSVRKGPISTLVYLNKDSILLGGLQITSQVPVFLLGLRRKHAWTLSSGPELKIVRQDQMWWNCQWSILQSYHLCISSHNITYHVSSTSLNQIFITCRQNQTWLLVVLRERSFELSIFWLTKQLFA